MVEVEVPVTVETVV
jgi:hypothetical protein